MNPLCDGPSAERQGPLRHAVAEVIFHNPNDVAPATAALIELDCAVEVLDLIDDYSPAVWVTRRCSG